MDTPDTCTSARPTLAFVYDRHATASTAALDERMHRCRQYAAGRGWVVAGEWVDRGDNALHESPRPQWAALNHAMRQAAAPAVCLVDTWDRISRDRARRAVLRRGVHQAGGHCVTTAGETDREPAPGRIIATAALLREWHERR
jgi:hypothetical protein